MPSRSRKQHNFMEMVAHSPGAAKRVGVPQSVGKEFAEADKGKKLNKLPEKVKKKKGDGAKDGVGQMMRDGFTKGGSAK